MHFRIPLLLISILITTLSLQVGAQSTIYHSTQLGLTFTQNTTAISYNVMAVPQLTSSQIGPQYLITGLSDVGYRYEEGLSYNWYGSSGFSFFYNVFGPDGTLVFPAGQAGNIKFS